VKADLRISVLYRSPSPWPRLYETVPALGLALIVFSRTRTLGFVLPAYLYVFYLLADRFLLPQSRLVKWIRNGSPALFLLGYGSVVLGAGPTGGRGCALAAVVLARAAVSTRSRVAIGFVARLVAAAHAGSPHSSSRRRARRHTALRLRRRVVGATQRLWRYGAPC
jgi:hypothetical protein